MKNHGYGYARPQYFHSQSQQPQPQTQQRPHQDAYGMQYHSSQFGYAILMPPAKPQAITEATVVVDTNVLLDYLMVIQKLTADIERTEWASVIIILSVVISELGWCVGPTLARPHLWSEQRFLRLL